MRPVATDAERSVVCVFVYLLGMHMGELYKTAEATETPFGGGEDLCGGTY